MHTSPEVRTAESTPAVDGVLSALMSVGRLLRQRTAADSLDPGGFWLLKTLAVDGPMRATDLAGYANLDSSTVSRHVAQLERSGLVERQPDPGDRRAQLVEVTGEGRQRLQEALDRRRQLLTRALDGWPEADVADLGRLLTRFVDDIENLQSDRENA